MVDSCRRFGQAAAREQVATAAPLSRFARPFHPARTLAHSVSCNCHTYSEKLGLWERLARVTDEVDCLLHLGDQIYGDSDFEIK